MWKRKRPRRSHMLDDRTNLKLALSRLARGADDDSPPDQRQKDERYVWEAVRKLCEMNGLIEG